MAQKNRANMLTDIVTNIFNNIINYITGQNAQDRFVNLLDSTPNILSDKNQADGYVGTDVNNEMISEYYNEFISRADMISKLTANEAVGFKFYQINDAASGARIIQVVADSNISLYSIGLDVATGETGTYDINTDVFTPIVVSGTPTLSQVLTAGNTSGANDIQFNTTQGLLFANTSRLREGTIDAGLGGTKGIAQICAVGYELKWEAGRLYVMDGNGLFIRQSLYNFTTTPTSTDDTTKGYMTGSLWTLDDGTTYICSDATATAAVWAIGGIPTLQQVTDVGATTTVGLTVDNGTESVQIKHDRIKIVNALGAEAVITSPTLATTTNFEIPNKAGGTETFAMLSDISAGLTALNGLTEQVQTFAVGTTGTDFAISSASGIHNFNLPTASASNRGALSSADWSAFNALKVENISLQDGGSSIAATTYTLELYAAYAYTINQLKIISASGTCTVAVKINGVDVTGISAVSVSSTIATGTATAANTVAIGDKITLVTTSNSALTNLQASLKTTRI